MEIFSSRYMSCSFTSLGLCTQPSSIYIYSPFLFYLEENYSFSKTLIRYHFLCEAFPNSPDSSFLFCVPLTLWRNLCCSTEAILFYLFVCLSPSQPGCEFFGASSFIHLRIFTTWQLQKCQSIG